MSSYDILQNYFPSGEISPLWKGRSNTEFYRTGLNLCRNFMPMNPSGLRRRPGTKFLKYTQDNAEAILIPCVLNGDTDVVVEIVRGKARVWFADDPLTDAGTSGMDADTVRILSFDSQPLKAIKYAFNKNAIWFVNDNIKPVKLTLTINETIPRTITIAVEEPDFEGDMTFSEDGDYPSVVGFKGGRLFFGGTKNIPNAIFCSRSPDYSDEENPDRYTDFTYAEVSLVRDLSSDKTVDPDKEYYIKNDDGTYTKAEPVGTEVPIDEGWYEDKEERYVDASNAIEIEDNEMAKPLWFLNSKRFLVGSSNIIFADNGVAVTPSSFDVSPTVREGSSIVSAKGLKNYVVYAGVSGKTMSMMIYNTDAEQYISRNITENSSHLFSSGIKDFTICFMPDPVVWVLLNDNTFLSCSVDLSTGNFLTGWAKHSFEDKDFIPVSLVTIPNSDGRDTLYIQVKVGSKYHIETIDLNDIFNPEDEENYLDLAKSYSVDTPTDTFMYDENMAGKTVSIVSEGGLLPEKEVQADGTVILDREVSSCTIGFTFTSLAGFLSQEQPANGQSSFSNKRRLKRTVLRVYQSFGGYIGVQYEDINRMYKLLSERYGDFRYGETISLVDEDIATDIQGSNSNTADLYLLTNIPMPLNVLALKEHIELLEV